MLYTFTSLRVADFVQFVDAREAYDDLTVDMKKHLEGLVANHSLIHSRKKAVPEYFYDADPMKHPLSKHKLVQRHESSGRMVQCSFSLGKIHTN